ncbi:MAG: zinc ribbon domain-containing protein [Thermoleophilia bacterium]
MRIGYDPGQTHAWEVDGMPFYEFKCKDCNEQFEVTCHMDERDDKAVCPKCGSRAVETVFTPAFKSPGIKKFPF